MSYKFENHSISSVMEVELRETDEIQNDTKVILFSIQESNDEQWNSIELSKDDVFKLIGALHLLHKEMK